MRNIRFPLAGALILAAAAYVAGVASVAAQAPKPGPLLSDPARGELRMLLDKNSLGSSEVSIGERNYRANYESSEHTHQGLEIIYIIEGEFHHIVNGRTNVLGPGMVGVVKPGDKVKHKAGPRPVKTLMIWSPAEEGERVADGWPKPAR